MERKSLKEFCQEKGFINVSNVRLTPENKYPFLTFYTDRKDDEGKAIVENIMFSKNAGEKVHEGQKPTKEMMKDLAITIYQDDEGNERVKLSGLGESVAIADLFE
jgi:hypothetical protein